MKFRELREGIATGVTWLTIGHYSKNAELWWREDGRISSEKAVKGLTHEKIFHRDGISPDFIGRVDHDKKEISVRAYRGGKVIRDAVIRYISKQLAREFGMDYKVWYFKEYGEPDLIMEAFRRGMKVNYHINPSASHMYQFLKNTSFGGIRLWTYNGDLYMWDAGSETHISFFYEEFPELYKESGSRQYIADENCGHFYLSDKYSSHFGVNILKNHKKTLDKFFKMIEEDYEIEWIDDRYSKKDLMLKRKS